MAQNRSNGTRLEVFSGKEASLNRVILQILRQKGALIPYDVSLNVKRIKDFMQTDTKTVYRRMEAQEEQGWIVVVGTRPTQPGWCSDLYGITLRGKAALRLDEWSIEDFLRTATDEQLLKLLDAFS